MKDEMLDIRKVLSGKDGRLYVTVNGKTYFLAETSAFTATLNITNADVQPIGSLLIGATTTGVSISITMTEFYIRDDVMMQPLLDALAAGYTPTYDFQGVLDRSMIDGQESRQTYRNCIADGSVNLFNFTPGELVTREWSFRVNAMPEQIKAFAA